MRHQRYHIQQKKLLWLLPVILLVLFIFFVVFKISGTSIGIYHRDLYGTEAKDSSLIAGSAQGIRSDEWLVWTQLTISQSENNFEKFNDYLGSGRDLSLHFEVPTKDWSAIFKPQNWAFFVLPLEYAFAFRWWFLMYLLIVSAYFFVLKLLPGKVLFSSLASIAFGLSPFLLWWYQAAVLAVLGYGLIILLLSMHIIDGTRFRVMKSQRASNLLAAGLLGFLGTCFVFLLYPPYQISVAIVLLFYIFGYLISRKLDANIERKTLIKRAGLLLMGAIFIAIMSVAFITDKKEAIKYQTDSVYPGARSVVSGNEFAPEIIMSGFVMPLIQSDSRASKYYVNQSEASNFILLTPFLVLPLLALSLYDYKRRGRIDWLLISIIACAVILLCRILIPFGDSIYELLLLDKVPHRRMLLGLGLLSFIMSIYYLKKLQDLKLGLKKLIVPAAAYVIVCLGILVLIGIGWTKEYPLFLERYREVLLLTVPFALIIFFLLSGRRLLFASTLLAFTVVSSFSVMPLYQGLGPLYNSGLTDRIKKLSGQEKKTWLSVEEPGHFYYEHVAAVAGQKSISGVQIYPVESYWIDAYGKKYEYVFDRKAHLLYTNGPEDELSIELPRGNRININFSCADSFIREEADFIIATSNLKEHDCTELIDTLSYPQKKFYFYKFKN